MLDLNKIRKAFADFLAADPTRFRMDAALAHVVTLAYQQGIEDGRQASLPACERLHAVTAAASIPVPGSPGLPVETRTDTR